MGRVQNTVKLFFGQPHPGCPHSVDFVRREPPLTIKRAFPCKTTVASEQALKESN